MMMTLRYYSEFLDRHNTRYRIEIHQEGHGIAWTPREVVLESNPVEIEWRSVDKMEPVQSSSATLNLITMSDREFADLYTLEQQDVQLFIYRAGALYWSGMLDPEIFEEPYSYKDRYVTSITFSDLGILDREEWDGRGVCSLGSVIDTCLTTAGFGSTDQSRYISTSLTPLGNRLTLDEVFCVGDNFYDEEGEAMTMREVLEEVLRPFALHLVQKGGRIYLYDLNALHARTASQVVWVGTDASLEADVVYNNVRVSFSPYASGDMVDGTLDPDCVLKDQPAGSGELIWVNRASDSGDGFRIVHGTESEQVEDLTLHNGAVPFRIDPEYSGSKEAGVMWGYRPIEEWRGNSVFYPYNESNIFIGKRIISLPECYLCSVFDSEKWKIKINLHVLFDVRYNPFEQMSVANEKGHWENLQAWCNYGYIPIGLSLCDGDGNELYYYSNDTILHENIFDRKARWVKSKGGGSYGPFPGDAWLCYYDKQQRRTASGFGGWQSNKHIIGRYPGDLPSVFTLRPDGEYIDLPPVNGYLRLVVFSGVVQYDNDGMKDIYSEARWLLYKDPKIEIVKANGRSIDKEDVEDIAWINKSAKEDLEIDTILGTMPDPVPSARGLLFGRGGLVFNTFSRAGHMDRLERLLIGTACSQYASRKHILSGTVDLIPTFEVLTDRSTPGQYILLSEVQHLREAESEIRMVQFEADNYKAIEYKDE